jgi:enoyl-CoA hydratase/carnithine racemase
VSLPSAPDHNGIRITHDGSVTTIQIDRPSRRNALDLRASAALAHAFAALPSQTRCVVLTGDKTSFCAGMDLGQPEPSDGPSPILAIEDCPVPVVAAIDGWCLGLGLVLALACDVRVASPEAQLGLPEVRHGFPPAGGIRRLERVVGPGRARLLVLTGRRISGEQAESWRLVDLVGPSATALAHLVAREIAAMEPAGVLLAKSLSSRTEALTREAAHDLEFAESWPLVQITKRDG